MQIVKKNSILLNMKGTTKDEIFSEMLLFLEKQGLIRDHAECKQSVLKREAILSTALDQEIALPHASCNTVYHPFIAIGTSENGVYWDEGSKGKTKVFMFILTPNTGGDAHLKMLGDASAKLLEDQVIDRIKGATKPEDIYEIFNTKEDDTVMTDEKGFLIGVTGCPTGIAHTYLAAKSLTKAAHEMGYEIKVETNGSIGVENSPTRQEIQKAAAVIVSADKQVELHRFAGKKVLITGVKAAIENPKKLIEKALSDETLPYKSDEASQDRKDRQTDSGGRSFGSNLYQYLMNGVSYMIPFVIVGGLLIAISLALGGETTASGLVIPEGSMWNQVLNIGVVAFTLMIPILSGYIAYAIGDRPALAAGMIGGWVANNGSFYNAESGMGFIGAIIAGLLVGYFVKYMKKIHYPKLFQPIVPIMIIPITATLFICGIFIFVIGAPVAAFMTGLYSMLESMSTGGFLLMGLVMGFMQGFDFGGPFGKVVLFFNIAMIAQGHPEFMAAQAMAIPVAPLGMGAATLLDRKKNVFTEEDRGNGTAALAMGLVGISEGAIPFAAAKPFAVLPATMIGSAVACILSFSFGITNPVPHGGPIILILGVVNKPLLGLFCMVVGSLTTAVIMLALRRLMSKK